MRKVTHETEEGDMLFAVAYEVGEELDRDQKDEDRLQDDLEFTCEGMVTVSKEFFREVSNCRATHEAICAEVKKASLRTADLKRKAAEAHEKTR